MATLSLAQSALSVAHIIVLSVSVAFGFLAPGYLCSVLLQSPARLVSSFLISSLVLFHTIFWLEVLRIPLQFGTVFVCLLTINGVLGFCIFKGKGWAAARCRTAVRRPDRWVLCAAVAAGTLMLARSFLQPLTGEDTFFRWNFLAMQILEHGGFSFYPPLKPGDFAKYFYVDGIPPLVSFSYWWLYASLGQVLPSLTSILVTTQFILTIVITYRLTSELSSPDAGSMAIAILLSSPLFFWSVLIGQETGLTALSFAAMIYFLVTANQHKEGHGMVLAGSAAAVGALAREYGVAFIVAGIIVAILLRHSLRQVILFFLVGASLAAPWYVRNWVVAGNPFYSNPVGSLFRVNPVHVGILNVYNEVFGFGNLAFQKALAIIKILLESAPLQVVAAIGATLYLFGKFKHLIICTAMLVAIWIYSAGYTAGGYFWSSRVLSPALVMLAVLGGIAVHELRLYVPVNGLRGLILVGMCYGLVNDVIVPTAPTRLSIESWMSAAFAAHRQEWETRAEVAAPHLRSLTGRILGEDAYAHAGLYKFGIEVVPVWSPEVSFIFDNDLVPSQKRQRLLTLGIKAVLFHSRTLNNVYLAKSSLFTEDMKHWIPYLQVADFIVYELPP